jgi:hypothetical protein
MKKLITLAVLSMLGMTACHKEKNGPLKEMEVVPEDVFNVELCETLYSNIRDLFKEGHNCTGIYSSLFDGSFQQRIVLTEDAEIFVTFIGEGAGKSNTLGWYSYSQTEQPHVDPSFKEQIVFPLISNAVLETGDTRQISIGKFQAGTVISFFLVVGGWDKINGGVDFRKNILYTDPELNKAGLRQNIMFQEKRCNDIVLGFEDLEMPSSDQDFNDILIKISDNNAQQTSGAFNMELIPAL